MSYARTRKVPFSTAESRLRHGWIDGKFKRWRARHPDYGGRQGWVYREI